MTETIPALKVLQDYVNHVSSLIELEFQAAFAAGFVPFDGFRVFTPHDPAQPIDYYFNEELVFSIHPMQHLAGEDPENPRRFELKITRHYEVKPHD